MMEERFFAERSGFPAHHARSCHGHPVDSPGFVRAVSTDFRKALATKKLALAGHVVLSLETIGLRTVAGLLREHGSGNSQLRVLPELIKKKFEVVRIKRNISIQIADHFIVNIADHFLAGVERMNLRGEISLLAHRKID